MDRRVIGLRAKRAGSRHEYRIAEKLSKALGEPIRRQVLSGGAWKTHSQLEGDLTCLTSPMFSVEIKFRRVLTHSSVMHGHGMIDDFIEKLNGKILIVVTGTHQGKRKNTDWLFCPKSHAIDCELYDDEEFHFYPPFSTWIYARLDVLLTWPHIEDLFGIKCTSNYKEIKRRKNWETKARLS